RSHAPEGLPQLQERLDAQQSQAAARFELLRWSHADLVSLEDAGQFHEVDELLVKLQTDPGSEWQVTYRAGELGSVGPPTMMAVSEALHHARARSSSRTMEAVERALATAREKLEIGGPRAANLTLSQLRAP